MTAKTKGTRTLCNQYNAAEDMMMAMRRRHMVRTFSALARDSLCSKSSSSLKPCEYRGEDRALVPSRGDFTPNTFNIIAYCMQTFWK
jgi:hypothetical protein